MAPSEDAVDVGCRPRVQLGCVVPVRHQFAGFRRLPPNERQTLTHCGGDNHITMCHIKTVRHDDQAASWLARLCSDGLFDRRVARALEQASRHPERPRGLDSRSSGGAKAVSGLKITATPLTPGATSLSN